MRRFTILTAAFALLAFLAVPFGMRGQTNESVTVSYGWEIGDDATQWTISEAIAATENQGNTGTYAGKINSQHTYVQFNEKVFVTSFSFAFKRTSNNNNYNVYIETSTDGSTWTAVETYAMSTFQNGTYSTKTHDFDGTTDYYVRFHCYNTTAVRYVDDVTITYSNSASTLEPNDLALTDAPVALTFDLYDNADAQVINYTTSSTGAVTVAESEYIETVVDENNKTITVTPIAVTNGAKTITINQAADDNYAAGSVTFTVDIADSTPFTGGDVTFDATIDKGTSPLVKNGVTFACTNGVLNNGSEYRLYKNSVTTFSVEEGTITQIAFTGTSSNPISGFASTEGLTFDGNNGTWTGSANSISFTASGAQVRATLIVVTVDLSGAAAPVINANDVEIAYDATTGSITYTINNEPDPAGTLTATTTSDWLTLPETFDSPIEFTCSANETAAARTATVTLTYTYGDSQTATKNVTVTQAGDPNVLDNISDITEVGADYHVKGMVVATSAKGFIICDGTGFVYTYLNATPTQQMGEFVQITGTTGSYNHVIQFTNNATIAEAEEFTFDWPEYTVITEVPNYTEGYHLSDYFQFEGTLTKTTNGSTNYFVAVGEGQIRISYPTTEQATDLDALLNKTVRIHGFFTGYASNVFTAMMESYEEVVNTDPSITIATYELNVDAGAQEGTINVTYANVDLEMTEVVMCDANGDAAEYDWIPVCWLNEDHNIIYQINANEGEARTAYLKVCLLEEETLNPLFCSDIVTINQAAPEAPNVTWDLTTASYNEGANADLVTWSSDYATMTNAKGSSSTGANNYLGGGDNTHTRFYKDQVLTITPTIGYVISSIVIVATSNSYSEGFTGNNWNNASTSTVESVVTVTPTNGREAVSVTISKACRATAVTVYYVVDDTPYITAADVEIDYNATSGVIEYTIGNGVEGGVLTASTESEWITLGEVGETVPFTCDANTAYQSRTATVTLTYTYNTRETITQNVTITQGAAPEPTITVTPDEFTNVMHEGETLEATVAWENFEGEYLKDFVYYGSDGVTPVQYTWFEIQGENEEFEQIYILVEPNYGAARTGYFKAYAVTDDGEYYSNLVTITQDAYVAPAEPGNWVETYLFELTPADVFVIVGTDSGGNSYAMSNDNGASSAPTAVPVTVVENTLSGEIPENIQWNISGTSGFGHYTFYPKGEATRWLYFNTSSSNNRLRVGDNANNKVFYKDDESGYFRCYNNSGEDYYVGIYNSQDWRGYTSNTGNIADQTFTVYKKVSDGVIYTLDIAAYSSDPNVNDGYRLIASPVDMVSPEESNGFLTNDYDLYYFDQSAWDEVDNEIVYNEWRNFKAEWFKLVSGKGYLYANSAGTTLVFAGQPYNGNGVITLTRSEDEGVTFSGWNLIGNPFSTEATINRSFYRMNTEGTEIIAAGDNAVVNPMEGIFVLAETNGETVTFDDGSNPGQPVPGDPGFPEEPDEFILNVIHNNSTVIDRAIVCFGNGKQLPKFQLNPNSTKIYFTQDTKDYAIVRSANQGEMPVNFKAAENGTYSLSVNAESMEMNYLHLIDNVTGADIDLLQTPNYTFEASTADYASRFRLVFSTNDSNSTGSESFAYFNGSTWMVSNIGEATLQVVDMMGRVLSSQTVSGNAEINLNQAAGVYVLRLVNGENVRTQKIVVK